MSARIMDGVEASESNPPKERTLRTLLLWVAGSLVLACLAAPLVYSSLGSLLGGVPYSRVYNRVALLIGLVLLWRLRDGLDPKLVVDAWRRETGRERSVRAALGFLIAVGPALLVLPLIVAGGEVRWSPEALSVNLIRIARSLPGAFVASGVEEAFFRAMVLGGLLIRRPFVYAAIVTSAFYAAIHSLSSHQGFEYPGWSFSVGFEYLARVLDVFVEPRMLPSMLGLFLIGLSLCIVYRRSGSLSLCIGLHAGWFMAAKTGIHLLQIVPGAQWASVAGKRMFLVGHPWTWAAVTAATVLVLAVKLFVVGRKS